MSKEILVFGSIVQDLISYVDHYPRPGESVRGKKFKFWCGGKGANQAVIASKLGAKVTMVGMVGEDLFGEANIASMQNNGVNADLVTKTSKSSTATGCVTVTEDGENAIVVTLGANLEIEPSRVDEIEDTIANSAIILIQSEIPQETNLRALQVARKHGVKTFLNPAPGRKDLERQLLPLADIICTNQNETEFIIEQSLKTLDDFKNAAIKILSYGPSLAIVTMGPDGALVAERLENGEVKVEKVDAPKVKAIDTTGAGDCFCGSLAYFLIEHPELTPVEAAQKAVKIAAISVSRQGVQASYPSRDELTQLGVI